MRLQNLLCYGSLILCLAVFSGCSFKIYQPAWPENLPSNSSLKARSFLSLAKDKFQQAGSEKALRSSIKSFKDVLEIDPGSREALAYLCNQYVLLGTAYTSDRKLKMHYFNEAMSYCEAAMYTNPDFRNEMENGRKPWEAAYTLQAEDAPAMLFWVTALQYEFQETMPLPSKMVNMRWLQHGKRFLDRIQEVDPEYGNGAVELAYTVYYCALPKFYGGDREKCFLYMDMAVDKSEGYLLGRWGRGRFFHQVSGDLEASRRDLEWVVLQDLSEYRDAYPWRVHFQEDAASQLLQVSVE